MRIEREDGSPVGAVWAVFTREEAADLLAALQYYFEEGPPDPGWHSHFGDGDAELTVAVEIATWRSRYRHVCASQRTDG